VLVLKVPTIPKDLVFDDLFGRHVLVLLRLLRYRSVGVNAVVLRFDRPQNRKQDFLGQII